MSYQSRFANELRFVMAKKQISQATVSRLTSLNNGTISRLLTGKRKVSYDTVSKIAEKLDMWKGLTPFELANKVEELQDKLNFIYKLNLIIFTILMIISIIGELV